jgi:transposase
LRRWKKQFKTNGNQAFPGKGHMSPEKEELDRLRKEVKKLRMEREILKKAAAFFANESE